MDEREMPKLSREQELSILFMDTRTIPESLGLIIPDMKNLGIVALKLMESGKIDHTFFTRNW